MSLPRLYTPRKDRKRSHNLGTPEENEFLELIILENIGCNWYVVLCETGAVWPAVWCYVVPGEVYSYRPTTVVTSARQESYQQAEVVAARVWW